MERERSLLDDYALSLTEAARPRVCFLPTASGYADHYVVRFYRRFSPACEASHVSLFRRDQGTSGVEDSVSTQCFAVITYAMELTVAYTAPWQTPACSVL